VDSRDKQYIENENLWDQAWPADYTDPQGEHADDEPDTSDEMSPFPEAVGTTDEIESVRDAEPYNPPVDPPVLPGGREGIHVATGFGYSAEDEVANKMAPRGDEDIREESLLILRQDSLASQLPLGVEVEQGIVRLYGEVQTIDEADYVISALDQLEGVEEVIDDTTLEGSPA
jgi:hypothetical protein